MTTLFEQALVNFVGPKVMEAAKDHARREFPKESCGFVAYGKYIACENSHPEPLKRFRIDDERFDRAMTNGKVKAVVHSHPNGPIFPSGMDMEAQITNNVPFIILTVNEVGVSTIVGWGDQLPKAPIIGRPFVHGIFDCYETLRDAFALGKEGMLAQEMGWPLPPIELPRIARDDNWWKEGDLYQNNLEPQGFKRISKSEVRPGDGFLISLGDRKTNPHNRLNHAGLLLEHNLILHHLPGRISRREASATWAHAADVWVRYEGPTS